MESVTIFFIISCTRIHNLLMDDILKYYNLGAILFRLNYL